MDDLNLGRIKELLSVYRVTQHSGGLAEAILSMLNVRMEEAEQRGKLSSMKSDALNEIYRKGLLRAVEILEKFNHGKHGEGEYHCCANDAIEAILKEANG